MDKITRWMHRYVSPVFLALLVASFILWYIAKLSYTYSTRQEVKIEVDGVPFEVTCVVEGVGTNLFGYQVYMDKVLRFPLADLKYTRSSEDEEMVSIDAQSLQSAIAVQLSDIKVLSIDSVPAVKIPVKETDKKKKR